MNEEKRILHAAFEPQSHGFGFANAFTALPRRTLRARKSLSKIRQPVIGLCGGMCFAALDYRAVGRPVPDFSDARAIPDELERYLRERQVDSLPLAALLRLGAYLLWRDERATQATLDLQIPRLRARLAAGQPTVLLLVRTAGLRGVTQNHQVIATGLEEDGAGCLTIALYDPNHPNQSPTLTVDPRAQRFSQSTGEPLRGFFVQAYRAAVPPRLHRPASQPSHPAAA